MTTALVVLGQVEARSLVDSIKADVAGIGDRIATAYLGRAWEPLGYADWDSMCEAEFDGARIRIPREARVEQVQSLRASGLSTRAIASALGVNRETVMKDAAKVVGNQPPAAVIGQDGKQYAPTQPPRAKHTETHTTKIETPFDPSTGEVLDAAEWREQNTPDDSGLPTNPVPMRPHVSPEAAAERDRQQSREAWSNTISKVSNLLARLVIAKPTALRQMRDDYLPEIAASHGGVSKQTLQDAAAFLLALADVWEDKAA